MNKIRHLYHLIFVTKGFKMTLPMNGNNILLDQIAYFFTRKDCHVYAVNAFFNHVHILVEIPKNDDFSKIVNRAKSTTELICRKYPEYDNFSGWTKGFDSFSVSFCDLQRVRQHIERQQMLHQDLSFEEEYRQLLEENGFTPYQASAPYFTENNNI